MALPGQCQPALWGVDPGVAEPAFGKFAGRQRYRHRLATAANGRQQAFSLIADQQEMCQQPVLPGSSKVRSRCCDSLPRPDAR